MKANRFPLLPTHLLTTAAVALGAALLLASPSTAEDKKTTLTPADESFIKDEAASGTAMVKIATMAEEKSEREDIKAFAETLVTDHTKANAELAKLAASKGVELTTEVTPKHAQTLGSLGSLSGAEFDREFISTVRSGHEKCVENFEKASTDAKDEDLKTWTATMLPALRVHLAKAKELGADKTTNTTTGKTTGKTTDTTTGRATETTRDADNTARNTRDRDGRTLTPFDQGNSESDRDTTADIRKAILAVDDMSLNAKNVKIITKDGLVTLRGPVESADEKRQIGEIATRIAGDKKTDNQLEVEGDGGTE